MHQNNDLKRVAWLRLNATRFGTQTDQRNRNRIEAKRTMADEGRQLSFAARADVARLCGNVG